MQGINTIARSVVPKKSYFRFYKTISYQIVPFQEGQPQVVVECSAQILSLVQRQADNITPGNIFII